MESIEFSEIMDAAVRVTGYSKAEIKGRAKDVSLARARQAVLVSLADMRPDLSLQRLAQCIGRSDHTTTIYHLRVGRNRVFTDPIFAAMVEAIKQDAVSWPQRERTAPKTRPEATEPAEKLKRLSATNVEAWADYGDTMKAQARKADHKLLEALMADAN